MTRQGRKLKDMRQSATDAGELFYAVGIECVNGHDVGRYVSTGACIACQAKAATSEASKASMRRHYERNRADKIKNAATWRQNNPERNRAHRLKKYGLTYEAYMAILDDQDHGCAICRERLKQDRDTHVDHCHDTGKVRGILCRKCNSAIGLLRDSPALAEAAASYLRRNSCA